MERKRKSDLLENVKDVLNQSAVLAVLDAEGRFVDFNDKFAHALGVEDLTEYTYESWLHPDRSLNQFKESYSRFQRGQTWSGELAHLSLTGAVIWIDATLVPVMNADGSLHRVQYAGFDITVRKAVEGALSAQQNIVSNLMKFAPVGIFFGEISGDCTYVNQEWSRVSGRPLRRVMGEGWLDGVHPEDREAIGSQWQAFLDGAGNFQCDYRYLHDSGEITWVFVKALKVNSEDILAPKILRIEQDVTLAKRNEQIMSEQRALMITSSRLASLGEMAGGISHEINNPLAIICAYAEQLKAKYEAPASEDEEYVQKAADKIEIMATKIAKIIRSLRTIARDGTEEPFVLYPVRTILDDTLEMCTARFVKNDVELRLIPMASEFELECRPTQVCQILLNLLNNAFDVVKTRPEKWIELRIESDESDNIVFSVTDSGDGIPTAIREKIFQPFFTTKEPGSGMGLGLSISKAIADGHSGKLQVDPIADRTRISLSLPMKQSLKKNAA